MRVDHDLLDLLLFESAQNPFMRWNAVNWGRELWAVVLEPSGCRVRRQKPRLVESLELRVLI